MEKYRNPNDTNGHSNTTNNEYRKSVSQLEYSRHSDIIRPPERAVSVRAGRFGLYFMFAFPLIHFIITYGYAAILIGSFFEGETILIIGGLAVQQGYLDLPLVFLCSFIGTIISDNLFFFLGRFHGNKLILKYKFFNKLTVVSDKFSGRSGRFLAFAMRFMYGFRHLVPFSLGMSAIRTRTFIFFNSLGGLLWVTAIGFTGYFFGDILEIFLGKIRHYEFRIIVIIIIIVVIGSVVYKIARYGFKGFLKN